MPSALLPFAHPATVREVIETSLKLFGRSALPCLPLATLSAMLGQLPSAYDLARFGEIVPITAESIVDKGGTWWTLYVVGTLLSLIILAYLLLKQRHIATGGAESVSFGGVLVRMPAILLFCVAGFFVMLVAALPFALIAALIPFPDAMRALIIFLPVFFTAFAVTLGWPSLVLGGLGAFAAVNAGLKLAVRYFGRLVLVAVAVVATLIIMVIVGGLAAGLLGIVVSGAGEGVQNSVIAAIVLVCAAFALLYLNAFLLVVCEDLQQRSQPPSAASSAA
jgi:hypothetical protein